VNRRLFLKSLGLGSLGTNYLFGFFNKLEINRSLKGRVVVVKKENPTDNEFYQMFKLGLLTLTRTQDLSQAWGKLISKKDIVGIKINTNHTRCFTNLGLIEAVIRSLQNYGLSSSQIIVWDRFREEYGLKGVGYDIKQDPANVRWLTTDTADIGYDPECYYFHPAVDEGRKKWYAKTEVFWHPQRSYFSKIVTEMVTKIINLPTLKHHAVAGVTLNLKNLSFGATNNTPRFHAGCYVQAIPEIFNFGCLREKTVLHVIDGIKGVFDKGPVDRGPEYIWPEGKLIMSVDPVAGDSYGLKLINDERRRRNLTPVGDLRHQLDYLVEAEKRGLGQIKSRVVHLNI